VLIIFTSVTMFTITRSKRLCVCARKFAKYRFEIENSETKEKYIAVYWKELKYPILYDACYDGILGEHNWYVGQYASALLKSVQKLMHIMIMETTEEYKNKPENTSIDHINICRLDNRMANLRIATDAEQNANKTTRSDKKPPPQELIDAGILELPKHVRWTVTEKKFVIENHPVLCANCGDKKPIITGTKSSRWSIVEKYQDIMYKLNELNSKLSDEHVQFQIKKEQLRKEYIQITNLIRAARSEELIEEPGVQLESSLQPELKTVKGRKTVLGLPQDCGVNVEDIPKYCYYRAASDKIGDGFVIDKHPLMTTRTWRTSSSKFYTTKEKFDSLMEVYNTLKNDETK